MYSDQSIYCLSLISEKDTLVWDSDWISNPDTISKDDIEKVCNNYQPMTIEQAIQYCEGSSTLCQGFQVLDDTKIDPTNIDKKQSYNIVFFSLLCNETVKLIEEDVDASTATKNKCKKTGTIFFRNITDSNNTINNEVACKQTPVPTSQSIAPSPTSPSPQASKTPTAAPANAFKKLIDITGSGKVYNTPAPTSVKPTPVPGSPTPAPTPGTPTDAPAPGASTNTPAPGTTGAPAPGASTPAPEDPNDGNTYDCVYGLCQVNQTGGGAYNNYDTCNNSCPAITPTNPPTDPPTPPPTDPPTPAPTYPPTPLPTDPPTPAPTYSIKYNCNGSRTCDNGRRTARGYSTKKSCERACAQSICAKKNGRQHGCGWRSDNGNGHACNDAYEYDTCKGCVYNNGACHPDDRWLCENE